MNYSKVTYKDCQKSASDMLDTIMVCFFTVSFMCMIFRDNLHHTQSVFMPVVHLCRIHALTVTLGPYIHPYLLHAFTEVPLIGTLAAPTFLCHRLPMKSVSYTYKVALHHLWCLPCNTLYTDATLLYDLQLI